MSEQVQESTQASAPVSEPQVSENVEKVEQAEVSNEKQMTPAEVKKEERKLINKLKLKVDGKEIEELLPFEIPDDEKTKEFLTKNLQLSKASQKRMQEMAEERKKLEALIKKLDESPEELMRELGKDPEEFAVALLKRRIEEEQKSPEQKELERAKKELEELRRAQKEQEEMRKKAENARLENELEQKLTEGITSALESGGLKKSPLTVKKMAEVMYTAAEIGVDLTPKEAAEIAKNEVFTDIEEYLKVITDEQLEKVITRQRLDGLRKKQIESLKKNTNIQSNSKVNQVVSKIKKEAPKTPSLKIDDWLMGKK